MTRAEALALFEDNFPPPPRQPKPSKAQAIRDAKRRGDKWIIWSGQMIRLDERTK